MSEAPRVFDCSGFIKYIFVCANIDIPRSTIEQAEFSGKKIKSIAQLKPGDLIFVHGTMGHYNKKFPKGVGHVGMYIGDKKIIHASSKRVNTTPGHIKEVGGVRVDSLKKFLTQGKTIAAIKRVI